MPLLVTERETGEGTLVSICDIECLGETYEEGAISLTVTEEFYGGDEAEELDSETAMNRLRGADTANLVGEECVTAALEAGIVNEGGVLEVEETLHAQVVWM